MPTARLGPWTGVDARTIDSRAVQGNPICGGYNYEVHGGELWPRPGYCNAVPQRDITMYPPFDGVAQKIISYYRGGSAYAYIIYAEVVFRFSTPSGALTVPYSTYATNNVAWVYGSTTINASATNFTDGDIIQDPYDTNIYYRIVSGGGSLVGTLNHVYLGTTGTAATRRYNGLRPSTRIVDACIFQQGVTHAAGAVWASSSAVTAGHEYLILAYDNSNLLAIDLTTSALPLNNWWRDSSLSPAGSINNTPPSTCCVHKSNLILGGSGDASEQYDNFCIWYSQPRDMLQWHTGISGIDAVPNVIRFVEGKDEIRAVRPIGDRLVVHRQLSQEVGEYTGSIDFPYRFTRNDQVLGINSHRQLAEIERRHFIYTHRGPAMYDGNDVRLFGDEVQDIFERDGDAGNTGITDVHVFALQSTGKVVFTGFTNVIDPDSERLGYSENWSGRAASYDVRTGQWAMLAFPDRPSAMGSLLSRTNDTTDDSYGRDLWVGIEGDYYETSTNAYWYGFDRWKTSVARPVYAIESGVTNIPAEQVTLVPAGIRTRWYSFDIDTQKLLTNIEFELRDSFVRQSRRRLYLPGLGGDVTGHLFMLRLRVYVDYDLDTAKLDHDIPILASDFGLMEGSGAGWGAEKLLKVEWPLKVQGDVFAFEFTNNATSYALGVGYKEGLWRIVDALVTYTDTQSMRRVNVGPG